MPKRIELTGIVGIDITVEKLKNELPKNGGKAVLFVDSEGGSCFVANRLFNMISDHMKKYPNSLTVEYGALAASAASTFPMAVGANNISVRENTTFMTHKAWNVSVGNSDDMMLTAEILDGLDRLIANVYTKITGKTVDETLLDMKNELWLFGGKNIVEAGFASEVIPDINEEKTEPVEKNVVLVKIEEAKNLIREVDNKEDLNKWVAKLNDTPIKNETKPPQADGNKKQEDLTNMELEEFLNQNPEAKAKNDLSIKSAVDEAVNNERARGKEILNLATGDVSESVMNAYDTGMTAGEYAVNEINANNKARKDAKPQDLGKIEPGAQIPTGENSKEAKDKATEDAVNKFLEGDKK